MRLQLLSGDKRKQYIANGRGRNNFRVMELEARLTPHIFFNLAKTRKQGRTVNGNRATGDAPGQRSANITLCAALSSDGQHMHKLLIGP